jgi:hypothetical protein
MTMLYDTAKARRNAPFHVQIKLVNLPATRPEPSDEIRIGGLVVQIFHGDPFLQVGNFVSFAIWVCRSGDEPTGPAYAYYDDLVRMGHVEVYLQGQPPDCDLVGYEYLLIAAPSLDPQLPKDAGDFAPISQLQAHSRSSGPSWWQFWKR